MTSYLILNENGHFILYMPGNRGREASSYTDTDGDFSNKGIEQISV
jgi:hypothetical protein